MHRQNSSSSTDIILGSDAFSTPDWKLNHSLCGKRESMKVIIRRKKLGKDILLKKNTNQQQTLKTLNKTQCLHRDLEVL